MAPILHYIRTAAAESGLAELIVEKNFWVVWLLEQLFALSSSLRPFTFKGGTSHSKGARLMVDGTAEMVPLTRTVLTGLTTT